MIKDYFALKANIIFLTMPESKTVSPNHFDLVILGGGSGAFAAAIRAAELGKKVAIIEKRKQIGGTCLNRGCIPSKHLLRAAEIYSTAKNQPYTALKLEQKSLDYASLIAKKGKLLDDFREEKYWNILKSYPQIQLFQGEGKFVDAHTLAVDEDKIEFDYAVIATGGEPAVPPLVGANEITALDSTSALELSELPASIIIIGGRAVALELGQIFHRFGVKVTILQRSSHILPNLDEEISSELEKALRSEGMEILTGVGVKSFVQMDGQTEVSFEHVGKEKQLTADRVLFATGKKPNTEKIGLAAIGVKTNQKGNVEVNEFLQTAVPHIYAIGDVVGRAELVTVSAAEGNNVIENLFNGTKEKLDYGLVPHAVFTSPQVAVVGLTAQAAEQSGIKIVSRVLPYAKVPKAGAVLDTRGVIKLVADADTKQVLGVQIVGENAAETIQSAVFAIQQKLTYEQIAKTIFVYPTHTESLKLVAQTFTKDIDKLSCCA